ncbi:putative Zn-dependent protease [Bradyrhizobium sp. GM5.1]
MLFQIALRKKATALISLLAAAAIALTPFSAAHAQAKGPPVLRDTETEQLLREYTRPILRVAGLEKQNIQMVIVNEGSFNAFVADGRRIFVNYGAILQSETPNQIIGVLAHETGHLAGGHLSKLREQLANAQTQMIIAMLLGAGAMAVGSTRGSGSAGNNGLANAGAAALAGPQEMIRRTLLSYQRQQEENADRAGVKFLTATQQSPKGMYETASSASPARACSRLAAPIPISSRTRCPPSASLHCRSSPAPALIGTKRTIPRSSCATTWCAPRSPPSWSGRKRCTAAIP